MYLTESREPLDIVTVEEEVDALVGVEPKKFYDNLHGKDWVWV